MRGFARVLAGVFIAIFILGLIPGITSSDGLLLDLFPAAGWHGLLYGLLGLAGVAVVRKYPERSRIYGILACLLWLLLLRV